MMTGQPRVGVSSLYVKFIIIFVVLTVILLGVIFYFSFSRALIEIKPQKATIATDFIADLETQSDNLSPGALAGFIFETKVSLTETARATGTKSLDNDVIGVVKVYNEQTVDQPLVATTRLLTADNVLLRLKNRITVPANGSVEAEVYADDPSAFESLAPMKFTIPGLSLELQKIVYAESLSVINSKPGDIKVVKAVDIAQAKEILTNKIYQEAIARFHQEVGEDYAAVVVAQKLTDEKVSAGVDDTVDSFEVEQTVEVTIMGIKQTDIVQLSIDRLKKLVTGERELSKMKMENFSYVVQNYNAENKTANVKIHAEGETVLREDSDILNKEKIAGLSVRGVELYLSSFDEIESVSISLTPFWVKRVPSLIDHITINILTD